MAKARNVRFRRGALELVVPGGQSARGRLSVEGAEVDFNEVVTGGIFTMRAMWVSNV